MDKEKWTRITGIIDQALALEPAEREAFVKQQCAGDEVLLKEVREQLHYIRQAEDTDFLSNLADERETFIKGLKKNWSQTGKDAGIIGRQFGSFTVTECLGEGGMGAVYKAERSGGDFSQTVAIKLIKQEAVSEETIHQFKMERDILARLRHPFIAQLYDAGFTGEGRPYLVMEYIEGLPIDHWCNKRRCSIDERLGLFRKVCQAVQFAHQNLVVHRDIKPQNILVTETGQVKVLDFGIAKLLSSDSLEASLFETRAGRKLWTPQYAAPEQVEGSSISIATDIYALGALLYVLLSGYTPYNFGDKTTSQVEQIIRNDDPSPPSRKLLAGFSETYAVENGKKPLQIQKKIQGDLDAMVLKAMRRNPHFRYTSVNELLDDLKRYGEDLPVKARAGTLRYRSVKYWKRHKTAILAAIIVVGLTLGYLFQLTRERDRAQLQAEKAQAVSEFLISLFEANKPNIRQGEVVTASQLLETGEQKIGQLANQPVIQSEMMAVIGTLYSTLSKYEKADSLLQQSLSLRKKLYDSSDPELANILYTLALNTENLGDYDKSKRLLHQAINLQKEIYGFQNSEVAQSLTDLSRVYELDGSIDSAHTSIRQAVSIYKNLSDTLTQGYNKTLTNLAAILLIKGDYKEAEQIQRSSLALSKKLFNPPHSFISTNLNDLGRIVRRLSKFGEAESLYIKSMEMDVQLYGPDHLSYAISLNNLAGLYYEQLLYKKADSLYAKAIQVGIPILGNQHPYIATFNSSRANVKLHMKQYAEAVKMYNKALNIYIPAVGKNHPSVATTYHGLGMAFEGMHNYDKAEEYFRRTLQIRYNVYEDRYHPYIGQISKSLARLMFEAGRPDEAQKFIEITLTSYIKTFGKGHPNVQKTAASFSTYLAKQNITISKDSLIALYDGKE